MKAAKYAFLLGAGSNFLIAFLHIAIILAGPYAYLYFGTAKLAVLASQGSAVPAIFTFLLAVTFAGFGLYALSGAGITRRLPFLRNALLSIGIVYTLRGAIVVLDIIRLYRGADYPLRQTAFSAAALIIGLLYLIGTSMRWQFLKTPDNLV